MVRYTRILLQPLQSCHVDGSNLTFLITVRIRSCGKVMFSQACVKNSVHKGGGVQAGGCCPGPGLGRGVQAQAQAQGGCTPACTEADTPPADGYCCGRYASYWNAFLLEFFTQSMKVRSHWWQLRKRSRKLNRFVISQLFSGDEAQKDPTRTRMYSSRMRTVRCSGRRGKGVSAPLHVGIHDGEGCLPQRMLGYTPENRMTDRQV